MSTIFERLDALEAQAASLNTDINNLRNHLTSVEETVEELLNAQEDIYIITEWDRSVTTI